MSKKLRRFSGIALLIMVIVLALPASVSAGGIIGSPNPVSAGPEEEVYPAVAYNSTRQEYLVVWFNDRPVVDDIYAQRLTRDGLKIGPVFCISTGAGQNKRYPDVAYNSKHDQYLVVWEDETVQGKGIRACRVSGSGEVLDESGFKIADHGYDNIFPKKPIVSYAYTSDRYMVVWAESWKNVALPNPNHFIKAQKVTETGALEDSPILVASAKHYIGEPDIAYNRHMNQYLVVWEDLRTLTETRIYGYQLNAGGFKVGSEIQITSGSVDCTNPAVASIPTSGGDIKFLVVYEHEYPANDHDIYGRFINEDGTLHTALFLFAFTTFDETSPAVTGNEVSQEYFVVWRENQGVTDNPIMGIQVSSLADSWGDLIELPCPAADNPAVSAGHLADFLIVWQDQPVSGTNMNIYSQLFGNRNYLPMIKR